MQASGSLRSGRGKPAQVGGAVSCELGIYQEDPDAGTAERSEGATGAEASRSGESGGRRGAGEVTGVAARTTGLNRGGIAGAADPAWGAGGQESSGADVATDGITTQKKSFHATERDSEANRQQRKEFLAQIATIPPEKLKFLDESGVTTQMTRLWGRAPKGQRIDEATPQGHWKVLTTLGTMSLRGIEAAMTIESPTDGEVFTAYLEQVLCPQLQPGDVVIMDNLSAHKVAGIRELIEARGAQLLYLPPYSPDLNPIEQAWSKFKQFLRSAKARTVEALEQAITEALKTITADNATAWFRHCGYGIQQP